MITVAEQEPNIGWPTPAGTTAGAPPCLLSGIGIAEAASETFNTALPAAAGEAGTDFAVDFANNRIEKWRPIEGHMP